MFLKKVFAFVKKEFLTEISYRFAFFFHMFGIFAWILTFYFIDKMFGSVITPHLKPYGVNYFSYVLLGIAFFAYVGTSIGGFATRIRNEQLMGTLEALVVTPTKITTIIISMWVWGFIWASISVLIYLISGVFLFGVDLTNINLLSAFVILVLTITSFSGLGLLAGSFIMLLKRGQPVSWVMNTLFELLGGVYFPIAVLPGWLQSISHLLPVTYSIRAMQLAVYKGYSLQSLTSDITALLVFSIILLPSGLLTFKWAFQRTKMTGSLGHY